VGQPSGVRLYRIRIAGKIGPGLLRASLVEPMLRYAITDRARSGTGTSSQEDALLHQAARLAEAGVDYIQLREKDLEAGALAALARRLLAILRGTANAPRLLINSRADVAVAVGADGVHLTAGAGSLTPADIHRLYAAAGLPEPVVSVSCHTLSDIRTACNTGATVILFGPVFEKAISTSQNGVRADEVVGQGTGLNLLHLACAAASPTPVLALGGITEENIAAVMAAGAAGVAAIRLFSMRSVSGFRINGSDNAAAHSCRPPIP
jgi:thiamine-phosphate pyrophosphorylase